VKRIRRHNGKRVSTSADIGSLGKPGKSGQSSYLSWRERYVLALESLGIQSRLVPLGDDRESYFSLGLSEGLVEVENSPVAWINTRGRYDEDERYPQYADFAVPDERLRSRDLSRLLIDSVYVRHMPLIGRVAGVRWRGNDCGLEIVEQLNGRESLSAQWLEAEPFEPVDGPLPFTRKIGPEVRVLAHSEPLAFWRIAVEIQFWASSVGANEYWVNNWQCVEALANELKRIRLSHR
jgi:hypothetical protein